MPQARKLDEMLAKRGQAIDKVLNFVVPDALLVSRLCGGRQGQGRGFWFIPGSGRERVEAGAGEEAFPCARQAGCPHASPR